jgi:hypothetical protein
MDPKSAAAWAVKTPGTIRQEAISKVAGGWADQNITDAAGWATRLPDKLDRQSAVTQVASAAAYTKPLLALELAMTLSPGSSLDDIVTQASRSWADKSPEDALLWVREISDTGLRERALSSVIVVLADSDPVSAANLAVDSLAPGKYQDQALLAIVQRWAAKDSNAASKWVAQFPEGELRDTANTVLDETIKRRGGSISRL